MILMQLISKVGKRYAIYIPKKIVKELNLREGDKILITIGKEGEIIIKPIKSFFTKRKYWSETTLGELEFESEELTRMIENED